VIKSYQPPQNNGNSEGVSEYERKPAFLRKTLQTPTAASCSEGKVPLSLRKPYTIDWCGRIPDCPSVIRRKLVFWRHSGFTPTVLYTV